MLVEINLLPQKEQRKLGYIIGLVILAFLFLLASILYYVQIDSTKNSIETVNTQIANTQKTAAQLQKYQGSSASTNSVEQLKTAIDWADKNRIETIPVIRHLTALLPERGFIQTFGYTESGTVTITAQFDTANEAAGYLNSLNHSRWIDKASLSSLTTGSNSSTASNSENKSTAATVDSYTNSKFLPRYTGQFEIKFNLDSVRKAIQSDQETSSDWEGGSGS